MAEEAEIPAMNRASNRELRGSGMGSDDLACSICSARFSRIPCKKFQPTEKAAAATQANRVGRMKL